MNDPVDDSEMLVALMRTAASAQDAPPAAFGHAEVVATSRRITRRRRMVAAGVAGLVLVAGVGTATVMPIMNRGGESSSVADAPRAPAPSGVPADGGATPSGPGPTELSRPGATPQRSAPAPGEGAAPPPAAAPPQASGSPEAAPSRSGTAAAGGSGSADAGPRAASPDQRRGGLGPAPGDCGKQQDPELRAVVEDVFRQAVGASNAPTTQSCRAPGERAVHLELEDGGRTGILTVVYSPEGGDPSTRTASGGQVTVSLRSTGEGPAPYADEARGLAAKLRPRL